MSQAQSEYEKQQELIRRERDEAVAGAYLAAATHCRQLATSEKGDYHFRRGVLTCEKGINALTLDDAQAALAARDAERLDEAHAMITDRDATIARLQAELAAAKLKGSFDVLAQIRDFRKTHPMDEGFARTFEFIGTLYYQYQAAIDAAEGGSRP